MNPITTLEGQQLSNARDPKPMSAELFVEVCQLIQDLYAAMPKDERTKCLCRILDTYDKLEDYGRRNVSLIDQLNAQADVDRRRRLEYFYSSVLPGVMIMPGFTVNLTDVPESNFRAPKPDATE